jgi:hypothetical protein
MSKEIDDYISQQNERLAADRAYNEAIKQSHRRPGFMGFLLGLLVGAILGRTL